jgi:hypothetical protein
VGILFFLQLDTSPIKWNLTPDYSSSYFFVFFSRYSISVKSVNFCTWWETVHFLSDIVLQFISSVGFWSADFLVYESHMYLSWGRVLTTNHYWQFCPGTFPTVCPHMFCWMGCRCVMLEECMLLFLVCWLHETFMEDLLHTSCRISCGIEENQSSYSIYVHTTPYSNSRAL